MRRSIKVEGVLHWASSTSRRAGISPLGVAQNSSHSSHAKPHSSWQHSYPHPLQAPEVPVPVQLLRLFPLKCFSSPPFQTFLLFHPTLHSHCCLSFVSILREIARLGGVQLHRKPAFCSLPASRPPAQLSAPSAALLTSKARPSSGLHLGHSFDIGDYCTGQLHPHLSALDHLGARKAVGSDFCGFTSLTHLGLN